MGTRNKPHKWANEIKAWADGATVQVNNIGENDWHTITYNHQWFHNTTVEYRILAR